MSDLIAKPSVELLAITPKTEDVIERAYRTCYLSFHRYNPPASAAELIKKVIRKICLQMLKILKEKTPIVFWDYEIDWDNNSAIIAES